MRIKKIAPEWLKEDSSNISDISLVNLREAFNNQHNSTNELKQHNLHMT